MPPEEFNNLVPPISTREGNDDNPCSSIFADEYTSLSSQSSDQQQHSSFYKYFIKSKGPPQVIFLCLLFALAFGCTVGVVPSVLTDHYAHIHYGFDISHSSCRDFSSENKPQACLDGSKDSQTASALASFFQNTLTFITSSLVGSLTDEYGRKQALVLAQFLTMLSPLTLVILQLYPDMNPGWYYVVDAMGGVISWIAISLSAISDVMPKQWRAPCFGLLLSGFSLGFAFAPVLALGLSHFGVSLLSLSLMIFGLLFSIYFLPETLPAEILHRKALLRRQGQLLQITQQDQDNNHHSVTAMWKAYSYYLLRPAMELSILNRNNFFRLLSALAFFSGMSTSADQTLLLYYLEDRLDFNDGDIAKLFMIIGLLGIFVQSFVLKKVTDMIGERFVIVLAFSCGVIVNALYATATTKNLIFLAVSIGSFGGMSFPTISAIKANNVEDHEQGRIQGALYALSSLASALGPITLRLAYEKTKDTKLPGGFFFVASFFYIIAVLCSIALPKDKANSRKQESSRHDYQLIVP